MTAAVQRSADDIDVWTRAFAEEQARQAGLPVRDWLNQFVADGEAARAEDGSAGLHPAATAPARERPAEARPGAGDLVDESDPTDPPDVWRPAREAFGQRGSRPDTAEGTRASAAEILARAFDGAGAPDLAGATRAEGGVLDNRGDGEVSVRARVSQAPRPHLDIDEIDRLLGGPTSHADEEAGNEPQTALLDVERALREIREQIEAAEQVAEARERAEPGVAGAQASAGLGQASTEAIAQLGLDIARLVDVMDCGFDRVEAASARQTLELRSEVTQLFDELATRLEDVERRPGEPAAAAIGAAFSPEADLRERDDEPAPTVDADVHGPHDGATTVAAELSGELSGELPGELRSPSPEPAASEVADRPPEAPAPHDPDWELFDAPPHSAAASFLDSSDAADAAPAEPPAWSADALPTHPAAEVADQPPTAPGDCDPDVDLFAAPPEPSGAAAGVPLDPADWPPPNAQHETGHWTADAEKIDVQDERAPGWRPLEGWPGAVGAPRDGLFDTPGGAADRPDDETAADGVEMADAQREALAPGRGKSSGLGWLRFGRRGQSRKSA